MKNYCQICTCLVSSYFTLLDCANFFNAIQRDQLKKSLKYFSILWPIKNYVRFEYVPQKNACFSFISIVWVHFSHNTKKFRFWKSLKYCNFFFTFFGQKSQIWICPFNEYLIWFKIRCLSILFATSWKIRIWNSLIFLN